MKRRCFLKSVMGVGKVISLAGCAELVGSTDANSDVVMTVPTNRHHQIDLSIDPMDSLGPNAGPREVNVGINQVEEAKTGEITISKEGAELFDGSVRFEAPDKGGTAISFRLLEPGEYEVTVSFEGETITEALDAVTQEENENPRSTMENFTYINGELKYETVYELSGEDQ